jgi:predicted CXXCH cytochrome family protein
MKFCLVVLGLVTAWALAPPAAVAQIKGTDHDLSSTAPGGQLCVACHTPHQANQTLLLWNHVLSALSYSWSDATESTGGTKLPTNIKTWSGSTKLCLSCHDGTVEVGKTYNPSSTWDPTKITGSHQIGGGGDLKGNHPVAVPYPSGGVANKYNGATTYQLAQGTALTNAGEWKGSPAKVKLFNDPTAGAANNKGLECASCHDPHGTGNSDFLRDSTSGSAICLNCHVK